MMRRIFLLLSAALIALVFWSGHYHPDAYWAFAVLIPFILVGIYDMLQAEHSILRNFPILGHFRYFFEFISPEIQQYFIERHTDGTPISRNHRSLVYQRAKDLKPTHPFGTELDLYSPAYEGLKHSIYPVAVPETPPRIRVGGAQCG